jgi:hypothetical protein
MRHHIQHDKIRLVDVALMAIVAGLLAYAPAYAQSFDDSSAVANDRPLVEDAMPSAADSPGVDAEAPATPDGATAADKIDDSTPPPTADYSDDEAANSAAGAADESASSSSSDNGSVLVIPQVVNLRSGESQDESADISSPNPDADDDDAAQSSPGDEVGAGQDLTDLAGQVGTVTDYQNQATEAAPGAIFLGPGVVVRFPPSPLFSPLPRSPVGGPIATGPIILPPSSGGPFPSTSPMLMAPRFGTFASFSHVSSFPRFGTFARRGFVGGRR